jgi:hypothetical protein
MTKSQNRNMRNKRRQRQKGECGENIKYSCMQVEK